MSDNTAFTLAVIAAHPGASAAAIARWTNDGGSTLDDVEAGADAHPARVDGRPSDDA